MFTRIVRSVAFNMPTDDPKVRDKQHSKFMNSAESYINRQKLDHVGQVLATAINYAVAIKHNLVALKKRGIDGNVIDDALGKVNGIIEEVKQLKLSDVAAETGVTLNANGFNIRNQGAWSPFDKNCGMGIPQPAFGPYQEEVAEADLQIPQPFPSLRLSEAMLSIFRELDNLAEQAVID